MNIMAVRHPKPRVHPYRHAHTLADSRAVERIAQPTPHLPSTMLSQLPDLPPHSSSWDTSSETAFVWDASTAGHNPERPSSNGTVCDDGRSARSGYCLDWEISAPARGYDAQLLGYPLGNPRSLSQYINGRGDAPDGHLPTFKAFGTIYTDDVRMKLGDAIRRRCFNCKAIQTTTWRRSVLSPGKMLCNKCGLFERTHAVPRPKEFPRRRRSRPVSESVRPSMNPPLFNGQGYYHYNDSPPDISLTPHIPNAFSTVAGETPPHDTSWMTQIAPHVSPTPTPHISPYPTTAEQSMIFGTDLRPLTTVPTAATSTASPPWELLPPHAN